MTCLNEISERAKRASASGIVISLEFNSISLYFTQISLNSLNFKFPWNSLNFWNSLRHSKFLRFRPQKEISLKVEALSEAFLSASSVMSNQIWIHVRMIAIYIQGRHQDVWLGVAKWRVSPEKKMAERVGGGGADYIFSVLKKVAPKLSPCMG